MSTWSSTWLAASVTMINMSRTRHAVPAVLLGLLLLAGCSSSSSSTPEDGFDGLTASQHVVDTTGSSLGAEQVQSLEQQVAELDRATGADVVLYVRALDATSEETFDQVEALQQAWVAATGTSQDTAVAILVNPNPDDANDARAGIFVGTVHDDGNVPRGEQEVIVADALIPPLRDGDVAASLSAGLDRLGSSIRTGPPPDPVDPLAENLGARTWRPWTLLALAVLGAVVVAGIRAARPRASTPEREPTTRRPDDLSPALVRALVVGGGRAAGGTRPLVLALAARDAVAIEHSEGGRYSTPKLQVRLLDRARAADDLERATYDDLVEHAEDGVVAHQELPKLGTRTDALVAKRIEAAGCRNPDTRGPRLRLVAVAVVAVALVALAVVLMSTGAVILLVGVVPLGVLALVALGTAVGHPLLSVEGRDAARPWEAYRDGLAEDGGDGVDLDAVLPDVVALNLTSAFSDRLGADDVSLRAFTAADGSRSTGVFFGAYTGAFTSGGSGGGGFSGGGAGGGGGAAGST